jgi:hypothetical protein
MSDEIDMASDQKQTMRDAAIRNASMFTSSHKACGKCLNCGEELKADLRWCNSDCRNDFEHRNEEPARVGWD